MASPQDNHLLATLPDHDLAALDRHFKTVELRPGETLAQSGDDMKNIYFPHSGIISFMVEVADGHVVQTSMVGRDGVIGAAQALDDKVSLNKIIVQTPGTASVIDRDPVREAVRTGNDIRQIFAAYEQFFVADIQQTAVCNALHTVEARMCRWLLRMMDLVGTDVELTQDQVAAMIGVRRSSISHAAAPLQSSGVITYTRGAIHIADVERLKHTACECHESVKQNYMRMFGIPPPHSN
jgi:CRP-like cAMP-binding protein